MEKSFRDIKAVMDAQGFLLDNKFYPREFSFVCEDFSVCYEVVFDLNDYVEDIKQVKRYIKHQRFKLHGLPLTPLLNPQSEQTISLEKLPEFVEFLYNRVQRSSSSMIATKNDELISFLTGTSIKIFDLNTVPVGSAMCPTYSRLSVFEANFCEIHEKVINGNQYRCALRKSKIIWNWLNTKKNSTDILLQFKFSPENSSLSPISFVGDTVF